MVFTAYPQKDEDQQLARVVISKGGKLSSVVDLATPSPDGGTFVKFGAGSAPGVAGDSVAFPAETSAGKAGWWLAPLASEVSNRASPVLWAPRLRRRRPRSARPVPLERRRVAPSHGRR